MRPWIVIATLAVCSPASAQAVTEERFERLVWQWRAANWTCASGQNHDGEKVDAKEVETACEDKARFDTQLSTAGYLL